MRLQDLKYVQKRVLTLKGIDEQIEHRNQTPVIINDIKYLLGRQATAGVEIFHLPLVIGLKEEGN